MKAWFTRRYLDILGSIYIYNEHRGYTALDRVLEAVRRKHPEATEFIAAVEKHRADERKHYVMFKRWFELQGKKPIAVDRTFGHIDRFIEITFGTSIDDLDTDAIIASDDLFERLCRVISLTEKRGLKQVDILLDHPLVNSDKALKRIFEVVHIDEPSHFEPYDDWLAKNARRQPSSRERWIDRMIHSELLFIKLPLLFLWFGAPRRTEWRDAGENNPRPALRSAVSA
ncbi:ferritin-like domain-containing protein [Erythrobacter sp. F6033]|uniref:ferritin-like domain-containing protein n=1 Tax=Erythrobacter sp. F6033 TaxID=2926401 RepID=UPI001FF5D1CC|nr:ferritin-like domain-containing protein [Erythrobacter sp. F6033]MCK0128949.1 ferritin-like domain-containing protein [Erythrobacter sp. F6033]